MKIQIHRGQDQIGGSIIEVATERARIFLDVGIELDEAGNIHVPPIDGLFCGETNCDGVFISHYHPDHVGLVDSLLPDIPVYMGQKAYQVMKAASDYRNIDIKFVPAPMEDGAIIQIKDLQITPILCDHSAFDSYMFLLECDGEKALYTGDFRANGRMDFDRLLEKLPCVDHLIIEGTTLSRGDATRNIEETKLEEIAVNYLSKHSGPAFIMMSAMNIDRVITAKNIAKRTNRVFLEDLYTAGITTSIGMSTKDVRVFITRGNQQHHDMLEKYYSDVKIGKVGISKIPFLMCVRSSMQTYLENLSKLVSFEDGVLFYAMWKGYLETPSIKQFVEFMERKGVKRHILHTSGHADSITIQRLIEKTRPKHILPVHTESSDWFDRYQETSNVIHDQNAMERL